MNGLPATTLDSAASTVAAAPFVWVSYTEFDGFLQLSNPEQLLCGV